MASVSTILFSTLTRASPLTDGNKLVHSSLTTKIWCNKVLF